MTVWNPSTKQFRHELDMVQNSVIRFICTLEGRDSVTEALEKLDVQTLGDRCKTSRHNLFLRLLSSEENHPVRLLTHDKLMTTRTSMPVTQAAERGDSPSIYAKSSVYHNGFLPKLSENSRLTFLRSPNC